MFLWSFLQLVAETLILRELGGKGNAGTLLLTSVKNLSGFVPFCRFSI
jgi:hypothetical protein